MVTFGQKLRQQRELREITVVQIAEATKISVRYLNALEKDDFGNLPGGVFNRGFVRAYAQHVGLDPQATVDEFIAEEQARGLAPTGTDLDALKDKLDSVAQQSGRTRRRGYAARIVAASGLVVLLSGVGAWWFYLGDRSVDGAGRVESEMVASLAPTMRQPPAQPATSEPQPAVSITVPEPGGSQPAAPPTSGPKPPEDPQAADVEPDEGSEADAQPVDSSAVDPALPAIEPAVALPETPIATETEESLDEQARLSVSEFGVGTGVVDHQLQGRTDRFVEGSEVWFWTRVLGAEAGERIRHVWLHEGRVVGYTPLILGGSHWRTHSRKVLPTGSLGQWSVEVRDAQDRVLAREQFRCVSENAG